MFPARITLFSVFGIPIGIDGSWIFLAFYLVLSLSSRYFPAVAPNLDGAAYIALGVAGALGLFVSIVLHELAHAAVARRAGLPVGGITLFIFGGVAELRQEPETPRSEFWVAIAGPIASVVIASVCFAAKILAVALQLKVAAVVLSFLAVTNTVLALFNLVPAFPLDGGRILRSILWWRTGNLRRATAIAAACGAGFGIFLMATGFIQAVGGNTSGGIWQLLVGLFLTMTANQARRQAGISEGLRGVAVESLMNRSPLTVPPDLAADALLKDYICRQNCKFVIVVEDGLALGYVGPAQMRHVPQSQLEGMFARAIAVPFTHDTAVPRDASASEVLRKVQTNGVGNVAILEGKRLLGVVSDTEFANYIGVRDALRVNKATRP